MSNILILANSSSGLYGFRNELVTELLKSHKVYVSVPDNTNVEELSSEGCQIIETPINRRGMNPVEDLKLFRTYLRLIKDIKPAVVLTYTIKPNVYGGLACRIKHVPYLANITGLGSALESGGLLGFITKSLYKIGLKKADTVFFQNKSNHDFFEEKHITKAPKALLPGSGVNIDRFVPLDWPEYVCRFLYISRIMKEKGIEEYLACAKEIKAEYPKTEFHILGYCEEGYEEELKKLNDEGIIEYHGSVKDVRPYLEKARCLIHPSFYPEGMSNVCLEAAACGRAVITTNRPGCVETVLDGESGYIVPTQNKTALISAVKSFLDLPSDKQKEMGSKGREYVVQHFNRQIVVDRYMACINSICQ
ncbi:galacturonosyltransferase [Lachnospiraceae bacterium G11]|nr:galacturonosyltransferase [Lachnospiraceae bacterium G11]